MTNDVIITRIINAPVATVWKMWTDPQEVTKWWGPADYTSPSARLDLRQGGQYVFAMQAPEYQGGEESFTSGEYKEITPMKKLVFTQGLSDADGNRLPADKLPADFPEDILTTVEFKEVNGMTELVITEKGWKPSMMSVFSYAGMHQSLDKLAAIV
ncbi:MAG TPA: SRPBCC domain-containing protein [Candidatus Saccharimonadales bacterium]|nr:SRPBCC domain-containing protein [Candidatus Saccharimonadales bacterium]